MPVSPPDRQIQLDILASVQQIESDMASIVTGLANVEAAVTAQAADISSVAEAQVIHEQLLRAGLDYSSLEYQNRYGSDADLTAILAVIAAIPTQV